MKVIHFEIPGEPQGKGRPRFSSKTMRTYTPTQTANYENLGKVVYQQASDGFQFADDAMLTMVITAHYSIPKSASKKKALMMVSEKIKPTKKPDIDNIVKVIADALNKIAYRDDSQIVRCTVEKRYSHKPRVEVWLADIDP